MELVPSGIFELPSGTRTVHETGPAALRAALATLDERLEDNGFDTSTLLRPGLPAEVVRAKFETVGLTPPDELVELYVWHDGYSEVGFDRWPIAGLRLAPLDLVVARRAGNGDFVGTPLEMDAPMVILEADDRGHAVLCDQVPSEPPIILEFNEWNNAHVRTKPVGRSICTWVASRILAIDMGYSVRVGSDDGPYWVFEPEKAEAWSAALALP